MAPSEKSNDVSDTRMSSSSQKLLYLCARLIAVQIQNPAGPMHAQAGDKSNGPFSTLSRTVMTTWAVSPPGQSFSRIFCLMAMTSSNICRTSCSDRMIYAFNLLATIPFSDGQSQPVRLPTDRSDSTSLIWFQS